MSDNEVTGKAAVWTEEAKYQFLLRVVAQLKDDGKTINWSRIQMPNRTTKSLQNMWTKINKAIAEIQEADEEMGLTLPKATPRKRGRKKSEAVNADDDDEMGEPTPKKPASARKKTSTGSAKKGKQPKGEDDEPMDPFKTEHVDGLMMDPHQPGEI